MVEYIHLFVSVKLILYDDKFLAVRILEEEANITKQKMIDPLGLNLRTFELWDQYYSSVPQRR